MNSFGIPFHVHVVHDPTLIGPPGSFDLISHVTSLEVQKQ